MTYDVVIAGASFAGLAVAAQLRGLRVLLVDRQPVGAGQTSACGTPLSTLRALGMETALQQVHPDLVIHLHGRTVRRPFPEPYCTFDYRAACQSLLAQGDAEVLRARVMSTIDGASGTTTAEYRAKGDGRLVPTTAGPQRGRLLVDASGWRAALASAYGGEGPRREAMSFGVEVAVPWRESGLHFWFDPALLGIGGMGWAFPAGEVARVGVASYEGVSALAPALHRLLAHLGLSRGGAAVHGGYFPYEPGRALAGPVFVVGDAAGHCLALNGEGIRPALYYGARLGRLLREVLEGRRSEAAARAAYRQMTACRRWGYQGMRSGQWMLMNLPPWAGRLWLRFLLNTPVGEISLRRYAEAFRL